MSVETLSHVSCQLKLFDQMLKLLLRIRGLCSIPGELTDDLYIHFDEHSSQNSCTGVDVQKRGNLLISLSFHLNLYAIECML